MATIKGKLVVDAPTLFLSLVYFITGNYLRSQREGFDLESVGLFVNSAADLIFSVLRNQGSKEPSENISMVSAGVLLTNRQHCLCSKYSALTGSATLFAAGLRELQFDRAADVLAIASVAGHVGNLTNHMLNHR